jgi:DNA-binding MarR family transcriptional regulator
LDAHRINGAQCGIGGRTVPRQIRRLAKGPPSRLTIDLQRLWTLFGERYNSGMAQTPYADQRVSSGQVFGYIEDEGSTLTELAQRAGISKQAMGELVDRLESGGYVERIANPHDRRAKLIRTTDKGERQIEASRGVTRTIEARWARVLGKQRFNEFRTMLRRLAAVIAKDRPM